VTLGPVNPQPVQLRMLPRCSTFLSVVLMAILVGCASNSTAERGATTAPDIDGGADQQSADASSGAREIGQPERLVITGAAAQFASGFADFEEQRVGLIANSASVVGGVHIADLVDQSPSVELVALFGPEHGLRGDAAAGEEVDDSVDPTTGVPVFSLYGENRTPLPEMLEGLDVLIYDLQDVGTRYFTYISTMGLAMQAAAEAEISFVILDRPNPLGGAVSGFMRDAVVDSFIAQYPIPDQYGLTAGELASAIVGEGWLPGLDTLDLFVVEMEGWDRSTTWSATGLPWFPPSPALQTLKATSLYPALVPFEATTVSVGRGTDRSFEVLGAPWLDADALISTLEQLNLPGVVIEPVSFTPEGSSDSEIPHIGVRIDGVAISITEDGAVLAPDLGVHLLTLVLEQAGGDVEAVINNPDLLDLLAGGPMLRNQLTEGLDPQTIIDEREQANVDFDELMDIYRLYTPAE
jgi:uncharacterized protein YbbC (DUF1343 family)